MVPTVMTMIPMPSPKIYNLRDKHRIPIPKGAVYCGRGTPYGNPFIAGTHGSRNRVIEKFVTEVLPDLDVSALRGKDLVCWCVPLPCHCTSILEKANAMEIGYEEGEDCNRDYHDGIGPCLGTLVVDVENCSCHRSAPCSACLDGLTCTVCGVRGIGPDNA